VQVGGSTICILLLRYAAANGLRAACPDMAHLTGEVGRHQREIEEAEGSHHHPNATRRRRSTEENLVPAASCPPNGSAVEDINVVRRESLGAQPVPLRPTRARRGTLRPCSRCGSLHAARQSPPEQVYVFSPGLPPLYRRPWPLGHRPRGLRAYHCRHRPAHRPRLSWRQTKGELPSD
jgi:hypothetical protein